MCRENCGNRKVISALQNHQLLLKYPETVFLKSVENKKNISSNLNLNRVFLANILGGLNICIIFKFITFKLNYKIVN